MTTRRCVLTAGHKPPCMLETTDRPRLRMDDTNRCHLFDPPEEPAESLTLTAPTPLDVAVDRERREAERRKAEQPVCPHCGFSPVSHAQWLAIVIEHLGPNATAVLEEITMRASNLGARAGEVAVRARIARAILDEAQRHDNPARIDLFALSIAIGSGDLGRE